MKTYVIKTEYGTLRLVLAAARYGALPHNASPLAVIAYEKEPEEGEEPFEVPYGTLTKNLDPWTGRRDQTDNRAFVKDYAENAHWAPALMKQLVKDGAAVPTGVVLPGPNGVRFRLYEFDTDKF